MKVFGNPAIEKERVLSPSLRCAIPVTLNEEVSRGARTPGLLVTCEIVDYKGPPSEVSSPTPEYESRGGAATTKS